MSIENTISTQLISSQVKLALVEDVGQQDLTADLIPIKSTATATLVTRESATLCGSAWFNDVFSQLDPSIKIDWHCADGDRLKADTIICTLNGSARYLLTGERTAMNYIQTLSATATLAQQYADQVIDLPVKILDTRKTIPGLRLAQKYAIRCGGCHNHRVGLYDGILIKENHINAVGSIQTAIHQAREYHPKVTIEVEVENLDELQQALIAQVDIILLDNFDIPALKKAVKLNQGKVLLEASGGITIDNVRAIAETGVDRISIGALTKDIRAIDLSMRFI